MIYVKPMLDNDLLLRDYSIVERDKLDSPKKSESPQVISVQTTPVSTIPIQRLVIDSLPNTVTAKSIIVYDLNQEMEIYQKEKKLTLPPASLVKMVSVLYFFKNVDLNENYNTFNECNLVEGQKVGYKKGEKVSGKDLIYSSLVFSGGDSICNMYKITNSNIPDFNNFSKSLGMKNSNFTNFIGLDYPGNYTTAEDLLSMTREFIKNPILNDVVKLKSYKMLNGKILYNTNRMLFEEPNSIGIKTGTTVGAKENLIYRHFDKENDLDLIIIVLNSTSRYQDTKTILKSIKIN